MNYNNHKHENKPSKMEENSTNFDFEKGRMSGPADNPMFMKVVAREQTYRWIKKFIILGIGVAGAIICHSLGLTEQGLQLLQSMISYI